MRSKLSEWYEVGIRYEKALEDGTSKTVTEQYIVEAMSFTEAESNIGEQMKPYIRGNFAVKSIKKTPFSEIFFSTKDKDDKWFKAKLQFVTINEKSAKEQHSNVVYLIQSANLSKACKSIDDIMDGTTIDYDSLSLQETKIMDVFEFGK